MLWSCVVVVVCGVLVVAADTTEYMISFGEIEIQEAIGAGAQGQVFKARWRNAEV